MIRFFDLFFSALGLLLGWPALLLIALIGMWDTGSPIFRQQRVGRFQKPFILLKFRTMRPGTASVATHLVSNSAVTPFGRFLRRTKLDELPQLWNVLKGEMSIVGPRPALWNQYDLIAERDKYGANDVVVGLTGWAQINGRDELPIEVKAMLDGEYVERRGLWFDVKCVFCTVECVCKRDGVVEGGTGTLIRQEVSSVKEQG